jgi:hypothetical protein
VKRALVSLPHEHGGYLTLAGGAIAAVAMSPRPLIALLAALAIAAAFFARAPLEKVTLGGCPAAFDRLALIGLSALVISSSAFAAFESRANAVPALIAAPALVVTSSVVRRRRSHRSAAFELVGMAALGASAGLMRRAGGASLRVAAASAVVLAVHAAVAVPLVRSELRPQERGNAATAERQALLMIAAGVALLVALHAPRAAIALAPRLALLLIRAIGSRKPLRPMLVGLRETATLAFAVALLIAWRGA